MHSKQTATLVLSYSQSLNYVNLPIVGALFKVKVCYFNSLFLRVIKQYGFYREVTLHGSYA